MGGKNPCVNELGNGTCISWVAQVGPVRIRFVHGAVPSCLVSVLALGAPFLDRSLLCSERYGSGSSVRSWKFDQTVACRVLRASQSY